MIEVSKHLYVGGIDDFHSQDAGSVVSATKTVHSKFVGAQRGDPEYIVAVRPFHLMLNWVDGPAHLYTWGGPELFNQILDFVQESIIGRGEPCLVHCDQGHSRAPTVAMLYMAKRSREIPDDPHGARGAFLDVYPRYQPAGIFEYVQRHWGEIW